MKYDEKLNSQKSHFVEELWVSQHTSKNEPNLPMICRII